MRLHVVNLPHTLVTKDYAYCAYSMKTLRFVNMMTSLGHEVFLYAGGEEHETNATEFIPVVRPADRKLWFGHEHWPTNMVFSHWSPDDPCWVEMNARVADEIEKRLQPGDVVGIISGRCQESLYHQFKDRAKVVEWGIGYEGVVTDYRVFESWAWAHHVAGLRHENPIRYWDAVVPNSYDAEDFTPSYEPGSYLFYMARPTPAKGMQIVRAIAERTNMPIVTAGQGGSWLEGADHRGVVLREEKAALLAGAAALLSPTIYLEPFGGVTIEAMLSGTPVITTDWGVYTETVQNGSNGYRCRTLREFLDAVEKVQTLDRHQVRRAGERYLTTNVRHEYNTYFERLATLDGGGWNQL